MTKVTSSPSGAKADKLPSPVKLLLLAFVIAVGLSGVSGFVQVEQAGYKCSQSDAGVELATTYGFPAAYYIHPTFSECYSSEDKIVDVKPKGFYLKEFLLDSVIYLPAAFVISLYVRNINRRRASSSFKKLLTELIGGYIALTFIAGFAWSGRATDPNCNSMNTLSPYRLENIYGFPLPFLEHQNVYVGCSWAATRESPKNPYLLNQKALLVDISVAALGAGVVILAAKKLAGATRRSTTK